MECVTAGTKEGGWGGGRGKKQEWSGVLHQGGEREREMMCGR